jgi:hypothetical protein
MPKQLPLTNKVNVYNMPFPPDVAKFLTEKQILLLKCYMANYNFLEMSKAIGKTYRKRDELIDALIDLGKALAVYNLLECDISPNIFGSEKSKEYLKGFNDCKNQIWRLIKDDKKYRR